MPLYLYDDARARGFEPFALTRPFGEMRIGALLGRERWRHAAAGEAVVGHIAAAHLTDFDEPGAAPVLAMSAILPAGAILANARCAPTVGATLSDGDDLWLCDGEPAAIRLAGARRVADFADGAVTLAALVGARAKTATLAGRWIGHPWELIADQQLALQLNDDLTRLGPTLDTRTPVAPEIIGGPHGSVYVERGAMIEGLTVLDSSSGPIVVRRGATVLAFTRLVGPCYVGEDSVIAGGGERVSGCAIGNDCRVHGEISASVVLGFSNKTHAGFVGHSYLGRWVNLGAGTTTSNLKNTYGAVRMWTPEGVRATHATFLGSLVGDFARTGIGTHLNTGTVVGAGANVFLPGTPPKVIPPFAWGGGGGGGGASGAGGRGEGVAPVAHFELEQFVRMVERQMARRHMVLSERARRYLAAVHARAIRLE